MTRTLASLAAAFGLLAGACPASLPARPDLPPPAGQAAASAAARRGDTLPNGLEVTRLPAADGVVHFALLMAGGPLEDPAAMPGLTDLVARAALLGTAGDPDPDTRPAQRAFALGGTLYAVSDGNVFGWVVLGPAAEAPALLGVLADVALRPTFPATRVRDLAEARREGTEADANATIMVALSVGAGVATGRGRRLPLDVEAAPLAKLNREDLVRHHARLVRPDHAALVIAGEAPGASGEALGTLFGAWRPATDRAAPTPACWPAAPSAHIVVDAAADREQVYTVIAVRAPGPGEPGRAALEVLHKALGATPNGRVTKALGLTRGPLSAPRLVDLGRGDGRGASVLLMRASGPNRRALLDLWQLVKLLREVPERPPAGEELAVAERQAAALRVQRGDHLIARLLGAGTEALYGQAPPLDALGDAALLRRMFVDSLTVVGVGQLELGVVFEQLGAVSAWSAEGALIGGADPPGCRRPTAK
jgi:hypothetical protein